MKKLYYSILPIFILFSNGNFCLAQTGPGGVGSSANNRLWLDANTLALGNGAQVSTWADISGNGYFATSANTKRPIFRTAQLNGFPSLDFDGVDDFIRAASVSGLGGQPISWFMVGNYNTTANSQVMLHFQHFGSAFNSNLRFSLCYNNGTINRMNSCNLNTTGGGVNSNFTLTTNTQIFSTTISATTINTFTDGVATGTNTAAFYTPVNGNQYVTLGKRNNQNDYHMDGNVAEVIVYNFELNNTQRILVENYLSSKYNLALGSNDFYALEASGHYFNVSGIGMVGGNSVNNAEGRSGVQISGANDLANNEFLLWGHDNASLTVNSTNIPPVFSNFGGTRLNRTWRVDETGSVGVYTLAINMSAMPALGASTADYILIIDDDGDFSNGGTTYHSNGYTFLGGVASWTGVDLPDGAYFTVAYAPAIFSITTGTWDDISTWNCNCEPVAGDGDVFISPGDVVTVSSTATVDNLFVTATGTLLFSGGNELDMTGNLDVDGTFDGTDGIFVCNGIAAQTISSSTTNIYDQFLVDNPTSVTFISGAHEIYEMLGMYNAAGTLDVGTDLVTMISDATATAIIDQVDGTIAGTMIIQRFISARLDGFSTFSTPISGSTFDQIDDDFEILFAPLVFWNSVPSCWGYDETAFDFFGIETSATAMTPGEGYEVYLDNDGSDVTPFAATTIDFRGTPNFGTITYPVTFNNDGWNLVGNPYQSFINLGTFRTNAGLGMGVTFMVYNEVIEDYITLTTAQNIAPAQGFWVQMTAAGNVSFVEGDKITSNSSNYRTGEEYDFHLRVSSNHVKNKSHTYFRFNESASLNYEFDHDLSFLKLPFKHAPSLYSNSADGKNLRINELKDEDYLKIPITFEPGVEGKYIIDALNIESALFEGYNQIILEDLKTGARISLINNSYSFDALMNDEHERFILHLIKSAPVTLENIEEVSFVNTTNGVNINFAYEFEKEALISVFNVAGQEILNDIRATVSFNQVEVILPRDYTGIYLVRIMVGDKIITKRFYKN